MHTNKYSSEAFDALTSNYLITFLLVKC